MTNKTEKIITALYLIQILLCIYYFFQIFTIKDFYYLNSYNNNFWAFLFFPFFFILTFFYKRKYKTLINNNVVNNVAGRLKYTAWIIFFTALITFIISANLLNKNFDTNYSKLNDQIGMSYYIILDLSGFIWPIILILFAINFQKNKDINLRCQNLKNATMAMFILGVLILFHKAIGLIIYDLELFTILKLFK